MPLSKRRNRIRMRRLRAQQALLGDKAGLRKRLWDMRLTVKAKESRIEWQSSGILHLQEEIGKLKALLAIQPAMQDTEVLKRLAVLETEQALHEAEHGGRVVPEPEMPAFKDLKRFVELHNQGEREAARLDEALREAQG